MFYSSTNANFPYPARIRRVASTLSLLVLFLNLAEYLLAWARAFYAWVNVPLQLPLIVFLIPPQDIPLMLLTAHLGLAFAVIVADALAFMTPRITLMDNRLMMRTAFGTRVIPLDALRGIRSVELPGERFVVWVDSSKGLPLQRFAASLIFGRWVGRGFFVTSDLVGFEDLVATMVARLRVMYGEQDFAAHFSEGKPTWLLAMLTNPLATIREVSEASPNPITQREAIGQMASVAASLMLPLFVAAIIHLQIPWGAPIVFALALLEFPLASLYLTAVPAEYVRQMEFEAILRLYPLTQLPRWIIAGAVTLLVIVGAPLFLIILVPIPALALDCYLVLKLIEDWFATRSPDALLGLLMTAVIQFILYAVFVVALAR
jgi:hypothetical protein